MGMDVGNSINPTQDIGQLRAFVDIVMSLRFHKGRKNRVIKNSLCTG
jgi:hypothetical protein